MYAVTLPGEDFDAVLFGWFRDWYFQRYDDAIAPLRGASAPAG